MHGPVAGAGGSAVGDVDGGCDSLPSPAGATIPPPGVNTGGDDEAEGDAVGEADGPPLGRFNPLFCTTFELLEHE
ncbi:hypothetical protein GCM10009835_22430 [Planosporangium flavigriseum]|uniref:Uncharacterized protein n=1 Tax=Planosporangium flavigriseum TaxID=373681 RepID=A0A8J3PMT7_9ACTN|nr:hypothetical protein Pfl04_43050 [Planosporangium flavigriseum]